MSAAPKPAVSRIAEGPATKAEPELEVSIVLPCLNESETVSACVRKAQHSLQSNEIAGEVIIADNGSDDGSPDIARGLGARVVSVTSRGYGNALREGIRAARGRYVLMADSDDSYDLSHLPRFLEALRGGADLVMGNRFHGGIAAGAMPFLHRYVGNPALSAVGRLFFRSQCGDFHCGMRAFRKDAVDRLDLRSTGMEFASEMIVKASLLKMKIVEVPTTLAPAGRSCAPHLRTWHDGWRHLRFLLMYSPRWLFLYPGLALITLGLLGCAWLLPNPGHLGKVYFDIHTLLYAFVAIALGFQLIAFAAFTKVFAIAEGLLPEDARLNRVFRYLNLETGLVTGLSLTLLGVFGSFLAVSSWETKDFGALNPSHMLRLVIPSVFSLMLGVQVVCHSFFLSILGLRRR